MKREIKISYEWWRPNKIDKTVLPHHIEALEEKAVEQIESSRFQGFTEGQLGDNIRMTDEDGEEGVEYQGYWKVETKDPTKV